MRERLCELAVRVAAPFARDEPRWVEVELTFAGRGAQRVRPAELTVESSGYEPGAAASLQLDR